MKNLLISSSTLERSTVIATLTHLREAWEEAADGQPINEVQGSVGLLLKDVLDALGLTTLEQGEVLGIWRRLHVP